ncbi:MAG: hypothetical protein HZB38_05710 [Planctomycetes bacterium]|nr:hypothetical protein [Planctomycetota bacterium]
MRNRTLGADRQVRFVARSGPGSFSDGVDPADGICQACHTATVFHRYDGGGSHHNEGADCATCHSHRNSFNPPGIEACISCHSWPQGSRQAVVQTDGSGGHHLHNAVLSDADCVNCHDTSQHRGGTVRLWGNPVDQTEPFGITGDPAQLTGFCRGCHDADTHPTIHTSGAPWTPHCIECHELHDLSNANLTLVRDRVRNQTLGVDRTVVFTARSGPGSFDDGVGANDGVCQVCHTATRSHRQDGGGVAHHAGDDCATCHTHNNGFIPAGGTSCIGCHTTAQGSRRPVLGEFGLASHHVQSAATDDDCITCHDLTEHPSGQVRLRNVDDPDNAAASVLLSGDPLNSEVEARKCEPFCLACHDSNAAGGRAPFSDGRMPAAINASLWAAGAHVSRTTCLGDGENFGCHATGHGSLKTRLQAPWTANQPAVPGDPLRQEEGMCYSCHDADGPALTDTQAQFALATHHKVSALEQADGTRLECRNCHDPHTLSFSQSLMNPDTREVWSGSGEAFCLTCHDGAPPADVAFPPTSTGTGFNKSTFVGTTHDSQTGPNSCQHCHLSHGSQNLAILRQRYVTADNNPYSPGDGDYAACWSCHSENTIIQLNNAFANRHKKHVQEERAPCIICHDVHRGFDVAEPGLIDLDYPIRRGGYDISFINGRNGSTAFYLNAGQTQGSCYIRCHSESHTPQTYTRYNVATTTCSACH